ncbi:TPA: hypothetical protein ACFP4Y_001839 [Neisseria bacilliformis]
MKALRIKEAQEEQIRLLAVDLNKKLVALGRQPLKDSELTHELLNEALTRATVSPDGKITIRNV